MTARQRRAWSFAAATVPAVMVCAANAWQWVLFGCAAAAGLHLYMYLARSRHGLCLTESYAAAFGVTFGRVLLGLTALWTLLALAGAAGGASAAFPDGEEGRLAPAAVLLLAGLACRYGAGIPARCAAVAAPVLAGLYLILILAAAPGVRGSWCGPWGAPAMAAQAGTAMLLPTAALFLAEGREKDEKPPALTLGWLLAAPAAMALVTSGNLSPQLTAAEPLPFYTLTKTLSLLSVMERFEPLLSAALFLGLFCMAALLTASGVKTAALCAGTEEKPWHRWAFCGAAFLLTDAARRLPDGVRVGGTAVFWGLMPRLAQVIVGITKVGKKAKKELTNGGADGNIAERSREGSTSDASPGRKTSKSFEKSS